ncbi:hypothetical protein [Halorientalis halophila]|uniref:hypothetical protein n=1 Tax=Halorientalis halophila TaxID=3108499 RepID=UPI00300B4643
MESSATLALGASGGLFMVGLVTGVWKYAQMCASEDTSAHYYVNTAHRASLLYSFAALILYQFALVSQFPQWLELLAVGVTLFFFVFAIGTYVVHGVLQDTDNQFRKPHVLGRFELPPVVVHGSMWLLIVGEIGGFAVLFVGFLQAAVL